MTVTAVLIMALPLGLLAGLGVGDARWPARFDRSGLAGEIPEPMLSAYLDAADTWDIDWALLAAIGKIECDHGRYIAAGCWPPGTINHAGARGPMQFLGSTRTRRCPARLLRPVTHPHRRDHHRRGPGPVTAPAGLHPGRLYEIVPGAADIFGNYTNTNCWSTPLTRATFTVK